MTLTYLLFNLRYFSLISYSQNDLQISNLISSSNKEYGINKRLTGVSHYMERDYELKMCLKN